LDNVAPKLKAFVRGEDGKHTPVYDVVGLVYVPRETFTRFSESLSPYIQNDFTPKVQPGMKERTVILSERYFQIPRHADFYQERWQKELEALEKGLLTVAFNGCGMDVNLLDVPLKTPPTAISVASESDNGKEYTLVVCSYPSEVKIDKALEPELHGLLPQWEDFKLGKKGRMQGGDVRLLMIEEETNVKEVFRDRQYIDQKFIVGEPSSVDRLQKALEGDKTALGV
jgi:hypothetical protein